MASFTPYLSFRIFPKAEAQWLTNTLGEGYSAGDDFMALIGLTMPEIFRERRKMVNHDRFYNVEADSGSLIRIGRSNSLQTAPYKVKQPPTKIP